MTTSRISSTTTTSQITTREVGCMCLCCYSMSANQNSQGKRNVGKEMLDNACEANNNGAAVDVGKMEDTASTVNSDIETVAATAASAA